MTPLIAGGYHQKNPIWLLDGAASPPIRASFDRREIGADLAALTTQIMTSVAVVLEPGDIITKIAALSGATAAGTPTNWWFALYSSAATPALLAQTADQTTTAWAADTVQDVALSAPVNITQAGVYYVGIMVKATTVPTLVGRSVNRAAASTGLLAAQKVLAQTSGSALVATAPATIATPTAVVTLPYVVCH